MRVTARVASTSLSAVTWPQRGQAALVLGDGPATASPNRQPVPIASVAKVMTAYPRTARPRPTGSGNAEAAALGLRNTTYTDPSGWDAGTVSTAADQLRVFRRAMRFSVFRQIVSMASVTLPVAGTLANTNPLIGQGYAGKTGSDSAAGACLAFFTHVTVGGRSVTAVGVVLGQWPSNSTSVSLAAAGKAAQRLVASVAPASGEPTTAAGGGEGQDSSPGGRHARHIAGVSKIAYVVATRPGLD